MTIGATAGTDRPLRADALRNYERLVIAAREVLRETGADASLEEIARRAGVGIGTLYRRFPTRLSLLEAVYREDVDALERASEELGESADPWPALVKWTDLMLDYAATKRVLFAELVEAVGRDSELLTHSRQVITETATAALRRAQDAGVARQGVEGADLLRLLGGCTMMGDLDDAQRQRVVDIVLAGIRV